MSESFEFMLNTIHGKRIYINGENISKALEDYSNQNKRNLTSLSFNSLIVEGVDFSEVNFSNSKFWNISFNNCSFINSKFNDTVLTNVSFIDCDLSKAVFQNSKIFDTSFNSSSVKLMDLSKAQQQNVLFLNGSDSSSLKKEPWKIKYDRKKIHPIELRLRSDPPVNRSSQSKICLHGTKSYIQCETRAEAKKLRYWLKEIQTRTASDQKIEDFVIQESSKENERIVYKNDTPEDIYLMDAFYASGRFHDCRTERRNISKLGSDIRSLQRLQKKEEDDFERCFNTKSGFTQTENYLVLSLEYQNGMRYYSYLKDDVRKLFELQKGCVDLVACMNLMLYGIYEGLSTSIEYMLNTPRFDPFLARKGMKFDFNNTPTILQSALCEYIRKYGSKSWLWYVQKNILNKI